MTSPRTLLLHTGGTIGMAPSPEGLHPATGLVERALDRLEARGTVDLKRLDPLIDSANATPEDWNRLSAEIAAHHADYGSFVITHGTDTLAFTASALAMALEGLDKPVILTGAMVPLEQPGSDGERNLADALRIAGEAEPGVWIQFAGQLLRGPRARKVHSAAHDAFSGWPSERMPRRAGPRPIRHAFGRASIAVLPVAPGCAMQVIEHAMKVCDGIVLRCYGSGTVPNDPVLAGALEAAAARAIPVVAVSQTLEGGTTLGTYEAGAILLRHGVIDGRDMTLEAAYAKLALALATCPDLAAQRAFVEAPLCGEFGPTT